MANFKPLKYTLAEQPNTEQSSNSYIIIRHGFLELTQTKDSQTDTHAVSTKTACSKTRPTDHIELRPTPLLFFICKRTGENFEAIPYGKYFKLYPGILACFLC